MENDVLEKKDPSKDCVQQVPSIGWVKNNTEVSKSGFLMLMMEWPLLPHPQTSPRKEKEKRIL
jgi:hypothetical protein